MILNLLMATSAATSGTGEAAQGNPFMQFIPFIFMFVILWFLIIRPQRKRQKETEHMLNELKIQDKVITTGGIYGKVVNIKKEKNIVVLKIDDATNTKIEIQKSAIAGVIAGDKEKNAVS
ncbi:MAG: preprotein translocase subunit YajC [Candidatus Stygibacter australis]|nr:preprotein translocase subunit YajC [Candidatus Stygibacter australis]MDP8321266.1 preprotein translocase subunit YajC [Candidatus Stygibacter australis]